MPSEEEFLEGFGLVRGTDYGGYFLVDSKSTHQQVKLYAEYVYHITLVFRTHNNRDNVTAFHTMINKLQEQISKMHIMSGIKNPYKCIIEPMTQENISISNNDIIIRLVGRAHRIYKAEQEQYERTRNMSREFLDARLNPV